MTTPTRRLLALLVGLALLASGCAPQASPSPSSPPPAPVWSGSPGETSPTWSTGLDPDSQFGLHLRKGIDPVVRPETRVLSASDASRITGITVLNPDECLSDADAHPMCTYRLEFSALPSGVVVGSVLNSGVTPSTPSGLLVKVTGISGTTVEAVQATLQDALVQGEFWIERTFSPDQLRGKPTLAEGVTLLSPGKKGNRRLLPDAPRVPAFDQISLPGSLSIDVEPADGLHVTGTIDFGAGCGLDGGVNGSDIAWVEASCHAWESTGLTVNATQTGARKAERYFLADFPMAAFPIPIGPVIIVVLVDIMITVDVDGNVHADMHYGATQTAEVYGSLRFSVTDGLDHDGGVKVSGSSQKAGVKADASVTVLGRAELRLSAYGCLGFSVGGDASVTLAGGPNQNPRWRISGNAGIFVKVFLGLFGVAELSAYIAYHLKQPFVIDTYASAPPKITVTWPTEGAVIRVGGLLPPKVEASALDDKDAPVPVTWTDETDHVTVTGSPQTLPWKALGPHTITVTATDSAGLSTTKTLHVTVAPPTLSVTLQVRTIAGDLVKGQPTFAVGATALVDAVITGSALQNAPCSALQWTATGGMVTSDGTCRARLKLTATGTASVTATITDSYQTTASGTRTLSVRDAPSVVAPQFEGIDVTAGGVHVAPGGWLQGQQPIRLTVTYLNRDEAKVTPTYAWSYQPGSGAVTAMPGASGELLTSTRDFTPPSPWGYHATFTVTVRNKANNAVLLTRTFLVNWQSNPK